MHNVNSLPNPASALLSLYPTGTSARLTLRGINRHPLPNSFIAISITSVYPFFLHISALFWFGIFSNLALGAWHKHRLASEEISSTQSLKIWFKKIDISTVIIHSTFQLSRNSSPRCELFRFGGMSRYGKVTVLRPFSMHVLWKKRLWIGYRLNNGIYRLPSTSLSPIFPLPVLPPITT